MAENLFSNECRDNFFSDLNHKPRILAFDFDGTLAPIAPSPAEAAMSEDMRRHIRRLADDHGNIMVIVSGRTLEDLKRIIAIPSIIYVGSHGMTSSVEGIGAEEIHLNKWSAEAAEIYDNIRNLDISYKGCIIENKHYTVAVHYRNVDESQIDDLLATVREKAREYGFVIQSGKMVAELKPETVFNKGTALEKIAAKGLRGWNSGDPFIFVGDDVTDEDGFCVMNDLGRKSFGIKIGSGRTAADYRIAAEEITQFIELLI